MADELLEALGAVADSMGIAGAPVKGLRAWLRRDEARNLLRDVEAAVGQRWGNSEFRSDVYEQVARHLENADFRTAFEAVTRGDADALEDVRTYLATHLGTESRAASAEVAGVITDVMAEHVGRAQRTPQAAVDVAGTLRHKQSLRRFDELDESIAGISAEVQALRPRVEVRALWVPLAAGPSDARRALERLGEADPAALTQVLDAVGTPPDGELAARLIDDPPEWVASGPASPLRALARLAELDGRWESAIRGWRMAAERTVGDERADLFARAAVAAGVVDDQPARDSLLDEARRINAESPRLRLEDLDQDADPDVQLEMLAELHVNDAELSSLIAAHKALAYLRQPDIEAAEEQLEIARGYLPDAVATRALAINAAVQKGRMAAFEGEPLDGPSLRHAGQQARSLRDELLEQRRFSESARLLMLAVDADLMSSEYDRAASLLRDARPEEHEASESAEVLAEVALRAGEYRRALGLLGNHAGTLAIDRQRATAEAHIGDSKTVLAALARLDEIAAQTGPEAPLAALARLAVLVEKPSLPWSDTAEATLRGEGHERAVVSMRSMQLARQTRFYDAERMLEPYLAQLWAREQRLRIARLRGNRSLVRESADAVLQAGPDQSARLECGLAYGWLGDLDAARRELWAVARDPSAATAVRLRAFRALLRTLLRMRPPAHTDAVTALKQWRKLSPGDPDAASWDVVIASQRRTRPRA